MNKRNLVTLVIVSGLILTACGNSKGEIDEPVETLGDATLSIQEDETSIQEYSDGEAFSTTNDETTEAFSISIADDEETPDDFSEVSEEYARKLASYNAEELMSELLSNSVLESACSYQPDAIYQQYSSRRTDGTTYYRLTSDNYFKMEYTLRDGSFNLLFAPNDNPTLTDSNAYEAIKKWLQETAVLLLGESVDFDVIFTDLENPDWGRHLLSFTVDGEDYSISFRLEEDKQSAEIVFSKDTDDIIATPLGNEKEVSEALGEQNEQVLNAIDQIVPILMSQESVGIGKNYTQEDFSYNAFTDFSLENDETLSENTRVLTLETCEEWSDTRLIVIIRPENAVISVRCKDEEQMIAIKEAVPEIVEDDDYSNGLVLEVPLEGTNQLILADYL